VEHAAAALFEESVSLSESAASDEDVLRAALSASNSGGDFTLQYAGSATSLNSEYSVSDRSLKSVFRDMMDRTSRVWWVEPASNTIHVQQRGGRGTWKSLSASGDGVGVRKYDDGSVDTVRNSVTVTATGGEAVSATASDSNSISEYGKRSESVNIGYATTQSEAQAYADELLVTSPLAQGEVAVPRSVGDVTVPLANYTIDLEDASKGVSATNLTVEKQVIEQGRATLVVGEGSGVSMSNINRDRKSRKDTTKPGSVYNTDRIADDAIETSKLVDTAVIEEKIADLSISETKIQDGSISTPKLKAEAVTAGKILAGTITAAEIAAGTLTANEIDVLNLDAGDISVLNGSGEGLEFNLSGSSVVMEPTAGGSVGIGSNSNRISISYFSTVTAGGVAMDEFAPDTNPADNSFGFEVVGENIGDNAIRPGSDDRNYVGTPSRAFREMNAYAFIDADSGTELSDGGSATAGLSSMDTIPDHCKARDHDGDEKGIEINSLSKWLFDVAVEQEREIERLEERIETLEEKVS